MSTAAPSSSGASTSGGSDGSGVGGSSSGTVTAEQILADQAAIDLAEAQLTIAQQNDVALVPGVLERGIAWLTTHQEEQLRRLANVDKDGNVIDKDKPAKHDADNIDSLVYMVLVDAGIKSDAMRDHLYNDRTKLAVYGLATYGLALHKQGESEKLAMILRNIALACKGSRAWTREGLPPGTGIPRISTVAIHGPAPSRISPLIRLQVVTSASRLALRWLCCDFNTILT